jgi:hypothetical protein
MSERNRLLAVIALIVAAFLVIVALILRLFFLRPAAPEPEPEPEATEEPVGLESTGAVPPPTLDVNPFAIVDRPVVEATPVEVDVASVASLFVERYVSYSNQSDYQNLRDLLPLMTDRFRAETEAKLDAAPPGGGEYVGVTGTRISSKIDDQTAAAARVSVSVQETKTVGSKAPEVSYKTYAVRLVKAGTDWKIDSVVAR